MYTMTRWVIALAATTAAAISAAPSQPSQQPANDPQRLRRSAHVDGFEDLGVGLFRDASQPQKNARAATIGTTIGVSAQKCGQLCIDRNQLCSAHPGAPLCKKERAKCNGFEYKGSQKKCLLKGGTFDTTRLLTRGRNDATSYRLCEGAPSSGQYLPWGCSSNILKGVDGARAAAFLPTKVEEVVGSQYKAGTTTWKLLWRGTRDGFAGSEFHKRCDNKGSTIAVFKSEGGFVFGGATKVAWGSPAGKSDNIGTANAFLYGIRTHGSPDAATIFLPDNKAVYPAAEYAMYDSPEYGPGFGYAAYDLEPGKGATYYSNLGHSYIGNGISDYDTDAGKQYFAGASEFKLAEIEVFLLV